MKSKYGLDDSCLNHLTNIPVGFTRPHTYTIQRNHIPKILCILLIGGAYARDATPLTHRQTAFWSAYMISSCSWAKNDKMEYSVKKTRLNYGQLVGPLTLRLQSGCWRCSASWNMVSCVSVNVKKRILYRFIVSFLHLQTITIDLLCSTHAYNRHIFFTFFIILWLLIFCYWKCVTSLYSRKRVFLTFSLGNCKHTFCVPSLCCSEIRFYCTCVVINPLIPAFFWLAKMSLPNRSGHTGLTHHFFISDFGHSGAQTARM